MSAGPTRAGQGVQEGRSINLALSDRGWRALEGVGVADDIRQVGIPMSGRVMHDVQGTLTRQPYGAGRPGHLLREPRPPQPPPARPGRGPDPACACASASSACSIDLKNQELHLLDTATQQEHTEPYTRLFGTDGAFSAVRGALQKTDRFDYSQDYLEYGYKELTIAAGPGRHVADGEKRPAHLAARAVPHDCAAQPRRLVQLHAVFSLRRARKLCRPANAGRRDRFF